MLVRAGAPLEPAGITTFVVLLLLLASNSGAQAPASPRPPSERHDASTQLLERIEAEQLVDVRAAAARARSAYHDSTWSAVEPSAGFRSAVAAMAAWLFLRCSGAEAAEPWLARAVDPGPDADTAHRVYYLLARARYLQLVSDAAGALQALADAQALAEVAAQPRLHVAAAAAQLQMTQESSGLRWLGDRIRAPRSDEVVSVRPLLRLNRARRLIAAGRFAEAGRALDDAETGLRDAGQRVALASLVGSRALVALHDGRPAEAIALLGEAREHYEACGDEQAAASVLCREVRLHSRLRDVARASRVMKDLSARVVGRGWTSIERELPAVELRLTLQLRGDERIDELLDEIDQSEERAAVEFAHLLRVEELLEEAAAARRQAQVEVHEARTRAAEQTELLWMLGTGGGALGLAVVALLSRRSRRRILAANVALAEQVRAVEQARDEQRRLQERVDRMQRAEELGTMAAGIAHDFNNLLTGILGGAELLRDGERDPKRRELAEMIGAAGRQGARLCRELQLYAGGVPVQRESVELAELVRSMARTFSSVTGERTRVLLEDGAECASVFGDRAMLEQVLLNLVSNACDAGARTVRIGVRREGAAPVEAVLEIRDDGSGMAPEVAARIFDPFFTTKFPGRGLGLAVVYGVVQRHGGTIRVFSSVGAGTTFVLRLPTMAAATQPAEAAAPPMATPAAWRPPAGLVGLFVDDEDSVRGVVAQSLRFVGLGVLECDSGDAALQALAGVEPGVPVLAFVDLTMPGVDGVEVLRRARECRPGLRTVLMSGHGDDELARAAAAAQPDRVLAKPFDVAALQRVLGELFPR
jgi:signal transduction histidine kinase/CheY-like chemotaxis protein